MVIYLPQQSLDEGPLLDELTPRLDLVAHEDREDLIGLRQQPARAASG